MSLPLSIGWLEQNKKFATKQNSVTFEMSGDMTNLNAVDVEIYDNFWMWWIHKKFMEIYLNL